MALILLSKTSRMLGHQPLLRMMLATSVAAVAIGAALSGTVVGCASLQDEDIKGGGGGEGTSGGISADASEEELKNQAKELFTELEPNLVTTCGRGCHDTGSAFAQAPRFLAGPIRYVSITANPTIVTIDPGMSSVFLKGQHDGPALADTPELENSVLTWLRYESAALQKKTFPTSEILSINVGGTTEFDLSKAGTIPGVKLRFDSAITSGILTIKNMKLIVPALEAGMGAHIVRPVFYRVKADKKQYPDPSDSFSNTDAVIPTGENPLPPGSAIFTGANWKGFDAGTDKIRIEIGKLEPGKIVTAAQAPSCKNPGMFQTALLPSLQTGTNQSCFSNGCHGNNVKSPDMSPASANPQDIAKLCANMKAYINPGAPANSQIIMKAAGAVTHSGGKVADTAGFTNAWTQAITGNQIF